MNPTRWPIPNGDPAISETKNPFQVSGPHKVKSSDLDDPFCEVFIITRLVRVGNSSYDLAADPVPEGVYFWELEALRVAYHLNCDFERGGRKSRLSYAADILAANWLTEDEVREAAEKRGMYVDVSVQ